MKKCLFFSIVLMSFVSITWSQVLTPQQQQQQLVNLLNQARQASQPAVGTAPVAPTTTVAPATGAATTTTTTTTVADQSLNADQTTQNMAAAAQNATIGPPSVSTDPNVSATRPPVDTGADLRDEAFATMTQTQLPMTPAQIRTLRKLFDRTQRAVAEYPGTPPKPTSSSVAVNLSPGATPPVIRLQAGFITSLVFVDSTGAPWPIDAISIGDPQAFNVEWDKKSNTLLVQAIAQYKVANLAVLLEGLNTPVMLTLIPGQAAVDYRVDLHVPGLGPNAYPALNGLPGAASPLLLNVLSGVPPAGSKCLEVVPSGYADAWLLSGRLYVRTRATMLSPAWISTMSSSDGTHAYLMPLTPLMMVSLNGKPINLSIQGY